MSAFDYGVVRRCQRCGGRHDDVTFQPLARPVEVEGAAAFTHWAPCPTTGEPMLAAVVPITVRADA